jgi:hypothetical protein
MRKNYAAKRLNPECPFLLDHDRPGKILITPASLHHPIRHLAGKRENRKKAND